jgi:hypothetical protein
VCETGQVRFAQYERDVGIGDEEAALVDDVGLALFADADARDDVPDELEVDVCDRDRTVVDAGPDRDRHVGLGLLAEIDRAEPRLPAARLAERRLLRAVLAGLDAVHA